MHLQADVFASTKGAANSTESEPHFAEWNAETGSNLLLIFVQPLRGDVERYSPTVVIGQRHRCLEAQERLVLHADFVVVFDHHIAHDVGVAAHNPLPTNDVSVRMNIGVAAINGALRIYKRFEHFVHHHDGGKCPATCLGMISRNRSDRLADIADNIGGKHWLIATDEPIGRRPRNIGGRDDSFDAGDSICARDVDAHNARRWMRRTKRGSPQAILR